MIGTIGSTNRRADGGEHEELALRFLRRKGMKLVEQNFRWGKAGEIDLVMKDGETYVFVEVKARRFKSWGLPEDALTPSKRQTIRRIARAFLYEMGLDQVDVRFDVVAIDYTQRFDAAPVVRHHVDAFD